MQTDDIIALVLLTGAGVAGYLLFTKQIDWPDWLPKDILPDLSKPTKEEEDSIVKDIDKEAPEPKTEETIIPKNLDFKVPDILEDYFKSKKSPLDVIIDGGKELINNIVKPFTNPTTTIIPKNKDFKKPEILEDYFKPERKKSLDELIADTFKTDDGKFPVGSPQRPYAS